MENQTTKLLCDTISRFLEEFKSNIPIKAFFKLKVLLLCLENLPPSYIKTELDTFFNPNSDNYLNFYSNAAIKKECGLYQRRNNTRISEIAVYVNKKPWEIISLIQVKTFINTVLKQYPIPTMAGFPFEKWTYKRMHKYIRLYFNIPKKNFSEIISKRTIQNSLYGKTSILNDSVSEIWNKYMQFSQYSDLYYLYLKHDCFEISLPDKNKKSNRKYNRIIFAALLKPSEQNEPLNIDYKCYLYNENSNNYPNLNKILLSLMRKNEICCYPIIFIYNQEPFTKFRIKSYNSLDSYPKYHLFLINDLLKFKFDSENNYQKNNKAVKIKNFLSKKMYLLENNKLNIHIQSREEKEDYIKQVISQIRSYL